MKKLARFGLVAVLAFSFLSIGISAEAKTISVKGYYKKSGTYVMPHYKTSSNKTKLDNYSIKGNYNPYTGKKGYVNPYKININL